MNAKKMNPDVKKKWVEKLRSGEYEQGREFPYKDGKFCCLGVLLDVAGDGAWEDFPGSREGTKWFQPRNRNYIWSSTNLPLAACRHMNLPWDQESVLIHMNDTEKKTFAEIADWAEANL